MLNLRGSQTKSRVLKIRGSKKKLICFPIALQTVAMFAYRATGFSLRTSRKFEGICSMQTVQRDLKETVRRQPFQGICSMETVQRDLFEVNSSKAPETFEWDRGESFESILVGRYSPKCLPFGVKCCLWIQSELFNGFVFLTPGDPPNWFHWKLFTSDSEIRLNSQSNRLIQSVLVKVLRRSSWKISRRELLAEKWLFRVKLCDQPFEQHERR